MEGGSGGNSHYLSNFAGPPAFPGNIPKPQNDSAFPGNIPQSKPSGNNDNTFSGIEPQPQNYCLNTPKHENENNETFPKSQHSDTFATSIESSTRYL